MIEALHGKSISQYSSFKNEILLTPGTKLRVKSNTLPLSRSGYGTITATE